MTPHHNAPRRTITTTSPRNISPYPTPHLLCPQHSNMSNHITTIILNYSSPLCTQHRCSSGGRPIKVPGSRDHYPLDARTFARWNVSYVKLDWCGDIKDEIAQGRKAHVDFAAAMNASGRAMYLEVVAGYWFLGNKISECAALVVPDR